ncbi:hypothetical protein BKG86_17045 [Mycobacteroides chelonae]|uniref:hypothetical protein n=1 Tax=Mycobacteroides chelonae TaxID=1774 RepID=UPI0008A8D1BF|nr:hypothetical protein [Mycobacteroides chelonae]OHU71360.1 hypothetical protein BKG86_17045 [Mycobacteroides chelonae]
MGSTSTSFLGLDGDESEYEVARRDPNVELCEDLKGVLRRKWKQHPRSQQKAIGPSEVGHPCSRKLATTLLQFPRINPEFDPLPAWMGTAGHAKWEESVDYDNAQIISERAAWEAENGNQPGGPRCTILGDLTGDGDPLAVGRWLSERHVQVRTDLSGTCDLFDTWTGTVIDLKFPGVDRMRKYKKEGPSPEYRIQAHAYGRGYRNEGFEVNRVGIWFVPRGGMLASSFVWSEPYDDEVVDEMLAKLDNIAIVLDELQVEQHPERLAHIPKVAHDCVFCPFHTTRREDDRPYACTGGK